MIRHGIKVLLAALLLASGGTAHAQLYSKFGPVTGVLKGNVSTPQTSAAAASDLTSLFSCVADTSHFLNGAGTCTVPAGTGVTSVALTAPSWYTVTGSPVTSTGTLAITAATGQAANRVIASPDGTTGAVSLRALVAGDIPPINLGSTANGGVSSATILLGTNGGTSNGFFSVTGPTTALRTFTFPNASATVLTTNAAVTVSQGGTGVATLTNHGVLLGQGTSNVSAVAAMAADTLLQGQGTGADPAAVAVNNCGSSTTALSYSTSTHTFGCQTISVGGTGTVTNVATGTGLTGGPITTTGTLSVDQAFSPTWTGVHLFNGAVTTANTTGVSVGVSSSTIPLVRFATSGGGSDQKVSSCYYNSAVPAFNCTFVNDAGSAEKVFLQAARGTGTAVSGITLGNSTDNPPVSIVGGLTVLNGTASQNFSQLVLNSTTSGVGSYMTFNNNGTQKGIIVNERTAGSNCAGSLVDDFCVRSVSSGVYIVDNFGSGYTSRVVRGATSIASGSATTVATLPNVGAATYLVMCGISGGSGTSQTVAGAVNTNATNAALVALGATSGTMAVTMSGMNLQCTQTLGSTQVVSWSYMRWGG